MKILSVNDPEFKTYGRIVDNVDFTQLLEVLKQTPLPNWVTYKASVEELESTDAYAQLTEILYGEMPIQIGYCNGHNQVLNALEYHRDSEVNVMATDAILLLGLRSEMKDDLTYDGKNVKAFLVPAGTAVEIYATSLHYAPCGVDGNGFQVAIILPKGTNLPLSKPRENAVGEEQLLTAVNKWLIAHPDSGKKKCFLGLQGEKLTISKDMKKSSKDDIISRN